MSGKTGPVSPFECEGSPQGRGAQGTRGVAAHRLPALRKTKRLTKSGRPHGGLLHQEDSVDDVVVGGLEAVEIGNRSAFVDLVDGGVDQAQFEDFSA